MALLVALFCLFSFFLRSSEATWCVCGGGANETALQAAIDFACGNGADCVSISPNGPCFLPNNRLAHCNFAVNSYFQRNNQAALACDFAGTATTTPNDPSYPGCQFPSLNSGRSPSPMGTPVTPTIFGPTGSHNPNVLDGNNVGRLSRPMAAWAIAVVVAFWVAA